MPLRERRLEPRRDALADHRHHRWPTDEHDLREPPRREAVRGQQPQAHVERAIDIVNLIDRGSQMMNGSLALGDFVPYSRLPARN